MRLGTAFALAAVCSVLLLSAGSAHAADVKVDCNQKTINSALARLRKGGRNIIHVSGTCNENVVIEGFDNLTLLANPGASLNDPTPSITDDSVVEIRNSQRVTIEGFTINQGLMGLVCGFYSTCFLNNNIVQGAFGDAVLVGRSSSADMNNDTVQNSGSGLRVQFGGQAHIFGGTIEGNDGPGAFATHQGLLDLRDGVSVQANGADGIAAAENSTIFLGGVTISGNGGNGVSVSGGSVLQVGVPNEITGNGAVTGGTGVYVGNSSFAFISGAANVSLNTIAQAVCAGYFSVIEGVGANTNLSCTNP